jgi:hypothetical protein
MYTTRTTCRLCEGLLHIVLDLGPIHVSSFVDTNDKPTPKIPIELTECEKCGLFQLRHTVNGDVMYTSYWYQSGLNPFMVDALKDVVSETLKRVGEILPGDIIVDIGANDGTLLRQYPDIVKKLVTRIAYEPSNVGNMAKDSCDILVQDYFNANAYFNYTKLPAKVITSIAMFYDLENPHAFVEDVRRILAGDGVWTIQFMDLVSMLKTNDFPNLCHEHLLYYKLLDIVNLMDAHGLEVFDAEYNAVNGSSLRVYVGHKDAHKYSDTVNALLVDENNYLMSLGNPADHFQKAIEAVKNKIVYFIQQAHKEGATIAVLGASTKGNTILQYFGLDNTVIDHAAEINPDKYGKFTIGSNIPIIPQTESLEKNPDYYLILPWGFLNTFLKKFDVYLRDDGAFIVPLPEPNIIYYKDYQLCQKKL